MAIIHPTMMKTNKQGSRQQLPPALFPLSLNKLNVIKSSSTSYFPFPFQSICIPPLVSVQNGLSLYSKYQDISCQQSHRQDGSHTYKLLWVNPESFSYTQIPYARSISFDICSLKLRSQNHFIYELLAFSSILYYFNRYDTNNTNTNY